MTILKRLPLALAAAAIGVTALAVPVLADGRDGMWRRDGGHGHEMRGHDRGQGMERGGRMAGLFETFDTDGDKSLTQSEIDAARAEQLARFDANGDGALSLEEYEALWLDAMRERMVDRFQAHDDDGDGSVTAAEFNEEFEGLVERFDRNGDGVLNADDMGRRMAAPAATAAPEAPKAQ